MLTERLPSFAAALRRVAGGAGERSLQEALAPYLRAEQRLGRISKRANVDAGATLLIFGYQLAIQTAQKLGNYAPVHSVRDRGVGGSNPLAPTNFPKKIDETA